MRHTRKLLVLLCLGMLTLSAVLLPTPVTQAQGEVNCFEETGYCIEGRIREFWLQNNGLLVFGVPITPLQEEVVEGETRLVQWFQRNRLELHPENSQPFDVQVGRVGAESLEQRGMNWYEFPVNENPGPVCQTFETGHSICGDMLSTWRSHGIEIDGVPGASVAESQALFGLPLSDEIQIRLGDGKDYTVQYFERARFERHPENPFPFHIQIGLLGIEVRQGNLCTNAESITSDADRFWLVLADFERTWPAERGSPGELQRVAYMRTYNDWVVFRGEFSAYKHMVVLMRPNGSGGHQVATEWHSETIVPNDVRATFQNEVPEVPQELLCIE